MDPPWPRERCTETMAALPSQVAMPPNPLVRADGAPAGHSLRQAAEAFEGMFIRMMLKSMRDTIPKGGLFDSNQMQAYQDMQDAEMATSMAKQRSIGIADMLVRQLSGGASDTQPSPARPLKFRPATAASAMAPSGSMRFRPTDAAPVNPTGKAVADTKLDFVQKLWPIASRLAPKIAPSVPVVIAQAALESGWGQHMPGGDSNNLFGIKAGRHWRGPSTEAATREVVNGQQKTEVASFRRYASPAESIADYVKLIAGSKRYQDARQARSEDEYVHSLQQAGYATDPDYASKVLGVLRDPGFQQAVATISNAAGILTSDTRAEKATEELRTSMALARMRHGR